MGFFSNEEFIRYKKCTQPDTVTGLSPEITFTSTPRLEK